MPVIKYPPGLPLYPGFHTAASILRYPGAPHDGVPIPPTPGDVARAMRYKQVILDYLKVGPLDCEEINATSKLLADATEYEQKVLANYTGIGLNSNAESDIDLNSGVPPLWAIALQQNIESCLSNFQQHLDLTLAGLQNHVSELQTDVTQLEIQVQTMRDAIIDIPNLINEIQQEQAQAKNEDVIDADSSDRDNNTQLTALSEIGEHIVGVQKVLDDVQHATRRAELRVMNDISIRLDNRAIQPLPNSAGKISPDNQSPITSTEHLWRLSSYDVDLWISHYDIPVPSDAGHPVKLTALRTFLGVL